MGGNNKNSEERFHLIRGFVILSLILIISINSRVFANIDEMLKTDCPYLVLGLERGTSRASVIESRKESPLSDIQQRAYSFLVEQNGADLFQANREEYLVKAVEAGFYKDVASLIQNNSVTGKKGLLPRLSTIPTNIYNSVRENFLNIHTANFYMAMAVISFLDSLSDPLEFKAFLESLKYPEMHIGFFLFSATSSKTNALFYRITKGKVDGRYLGLSAGVLVLNFFTDIYYHPLRQKIRETDDYKAKLILWGQIFADLVTSKAKWIDRGISLFSIIAVSKGLLTIRSGLERGTLALKNTGRGIVVENGVVKKGAIGTVSKFIGNKVIPGGIRIIYKGGKLSSIGMILYIGGEIAETVLFLEGVDLMESAIEPSIQTFFKSGDLISKRKAMEASVDNFFSNSNQSELDEVNKSILDLRLDFVSYRQLLLSEYIRKYTLWLKELDKVESSAYKREMFLLWIARGMDDNDDAFKSNEGFWHREPTSKDFKEERSKWLHRFIYDEKFITEDGARRAVIEKSPISVVDGANFNNIEEYVQRIIIPRIKKGYYLKDVESYVELLSEENNKVMEEKKKKYKGIVKPLLKKISSLNGVSLSTRFELSNDVIGSLMDEYSSLEKPYSKYRIYWSKDQYIKLLALFFTGPKDEKEAEFFNHAAKKLGFQQMVENHLQEIRDRITFATELSNWITLLRWPEMDSFLGISPTK